MALALAMSLGSMSLAQDLATDVGKGVKVRKKPRRLRQGYGPGHDEGCQENRDGTLFVDKVGANEDIEDV
jgi:hypothetical protein